MGGSRKEGRGSQEKRTKMWYLGISKQRKPLRLSMKWQKMDTGGEIKSRESLEIEDRWMLLQGMGVQLNIMLHRSS